MITLARLGLRLGLGLSPTLASRSLPTSGHFPRRHISTLPPRIRPLILKSRTQAALYVDRLTQDEPRGNRVCVFTDGSATPRGGVGGAARARTPSGGTIIMKEYLGPAKDYLSIEGEILGMALGVRAIKTVAITSFLAGRGTLTRATILVDCQQAIREVLRVGWKRSKYSALVGRFHDEVRNMEGMGVDQICLVWVPAHEGIEMNELVDGDAKAAASGESSTLLISGFQLYPSQSSKFV